MFKPILSGRLAKWALLLQEFEIIYIPQKVIKRQALANFLANHPIPDDWELSDDLPNEEVMLVEMSQPWKMFFDGAAQRDGAGARVVFVTPEGDVLPYSFTLVKCCSNNVAEYQALILGLEMAMDSKTTRLEVFGDSKLIINQVLLVYEVKKPDLVPYCKYAIRLLAWFDYINIVYVPRSRNKQVDALAKLATALTVQDPEIKVSIWRRWVVPPNFDDDEMEADVNIILVFEINREDWRQPFIDYIENGKLPNDT